MEVKAGYKLELQMEELQSPMGLPEEGQARWMLPQGWRVHRQQWRMVAVPRFRLVVLFPYVYIYLSIYLSIYL